MQSQVGCNDSYFLRTRFYSSFITFPSIRCLFPKLLQPLWHRNSKPYSVIVSVLDIWKECDVHSQIALAFWYILHIHEAFHFYRSRFDAAKEVAGRFPTDVFWDPSETRLFCCEARITDSARNEAIEANKKLSLIDLSPDGESSEIVSDNAILQNVRKRKRLGELRDVLLLYNSPGWLIDTV